MSDILFKTDDYVFSYRVGGILIRDNKILPHLVPNIPDIKEDNFGRYEIKNEKIIYRPKLSKIK